jgi:hypothetical protein
MPRPPATPSALYAAANGIAARLQTLAPLAPGAGEDWREARARYQAELAQVRRELETHATRPARIREDGAASAVTILGLRATCTAGLEGALRNWIVAARRRAEAIEAEAATPAHAGGEGAHG